MKILLAEDNIINQKMGTAMLKSIGFEPVLAVNGKEALEKAQEEHFDCIVMDLDMPIMDGYEAAAAIKERVGDIPIIALTGDYDDEVLRKVIDCGMYKALKKPLDRERLESAIRSATKHR